MQDKKQKKVDLDENGKKFVNDMLNAANQGSEALQVFFHKTRISKCFRPDG